MDALYENTNRSTLRATEVHSGQQPSNVAILYRPRGHERTLLFADKKNGIFAQFNLCDDDMCSPGHWLFSEDQNSNLYLSVDERPFPDDEMVRAVVELYTTNLEAKSIDLEHQYVILRPRAPS